MTNRMRSALRQTATGLLCAAAMLMAPPLSAEEGPTVYTGTLGSQAIVAELDFTQPDEVSGRYFYQKYHLDLPLNGSLTGDALHMKEGLDSLDASPHPTITLHHAEQGWQGEWVGTQGKALPLQLTPAQPAAAPGDDPYLASLAGDDPYEYLRLQGLRLQRGKQQTVMGYPLQWWKEPQSGISLFEIVSAYPPAQLATLNQQLRARLWQEVVDYHGCQLGASRFGQGEFDQTVTPEYLSANVISISIFTSYDCGGAHPDFGDAPLNLNARTGEKLALEDVLWVGQGRPFHFLFEDEQSDDDDSDTHNSVTFDVYSTYRSKQFAPWLVSRFRALYPEQMAAPAEGDEEGCNYSDPEVWNFPAWYFTPQGILFSPSFARVARACEAGLSWPVLPWAEILPHPGGAGLTLP